MSLSSTSTIKGQLTTGLGTKAPLYFQALNSFVTGKTSRTEFEESAKQLLNSASLIQLHNALIISLFDATATLKRPPTPPPPTVPKQPPRKRRRTLLPYQGPQIPEELRTMRSRRLKRWALAVGKRERERIQNLHLVPLQMDPPRRRDTDEIARERGVIVLSERGDPPGSRLPIHLHSTTHAPTIQHIADRINLICAQNGLNAPNRTVPTLLNLACEAKLKQVITHALTLTANSLAISSINPSTSKANSSSDLHHHHHQKAPVLSTTSFQTLFTMSPADLPNKSATAMRLALSPSSAEDDPRDNLMLLKDREVRDQRWQIMALLSERSTVQEALTSL